MFPFHTQKKREKGKTDRLGYVFYEMFEISEPPPTAWIVADGVPKVNILLQLADVRSTEWPDSL